MKYAIQVPQKPQEHYAALVHVTHLKHMYEKTHHMLHISKYEASSFADLEHDTKCHKGFANSYFIYHTIKKMVPG